MTLLRSLLLGGLIAVALVAVFMWVFVIAPMRGLFAPSETQQVFFLQDLPRGEVAVLLEPMLTGGPQLLVRDPGAIAAAQEQAYVVDRTGGGEGVGTFVLAMMGGRNMTPVLTVYVDRTVHMQIACNRSQCQNGAWTDPAFHHDIAGLAGAGEAVTEVGETHFEYHAYQAAFAAMVDNPDIYFRRPDQHILADPDDGTRLFRLLLPSTLHPVTGSDQTAGFDTSRATAELEATITDTLSGLPITIENATYNIDAHPILTGPWGQVLEISGERPSLSLRGYVMVTPNIVLAIDSARIAELERRVAEAAWPHPTDTEFQTAITTSLDAQGQPDCQPGCEVDGARRKDTATLNPFPPPVWDLNVYRVGGTP